MRKHPHQGHPPKRPRPRAQTHLVTLAVGILIVATIATVTAVSVRVLRSDYEWHAEARKAASATASAIRTYSRNDESEPAAVDAVAAAAGPGQVTRDLLPYASDVPPEVSRLRLAPDGALSVLTHSGALCSGVTFDMSAIGKVPAGSFTCGDPVAPPSPQALGAIAHPGSVVLEWPHPPAPIEDYVISYSADGGSTWSVFPDSVSGTSRTTIRPLVNGRTYLFRVVARNLFGESAAGTTRATPFGTPDRPTSVRATGGFSGVVSWMPPNDDGGRPILGYRVEGDPQGTCTTAASASRCELTDLPAGIGYTFTVTAFNDGGLGDPSVPRTAPVTIYSVPGRPVALTATAADGAALLTWTAPLRDGNTPILDYRVEYRSADAEAWTIAEHAASVETARAISGLANGTEYEFQVMAVNAAGDSLPQLSRVFQTPAGLPDAVPAVTPIDANASVELTWTPPVSDGGAPISDYAIAFHAEGDPWTPFPHPPSSLLGTSLTGLQNGTRYAIRVAAINKMGQGPWSPRVIGSPFGPPGPVMEPEAVGSLTAIGLTWKPPGNDGGRPLLGYRVDHKLVSETRWTREPRLPATATTFTLDDVVAGEAYDFRIVALNSAGIGASTADPAAPDTPVGGDSGPPTLPAVIADEMPPAPTGVRVVAGDRSVTLRWRAVAAGPDSPIRAYTVTGVPAGACTTTALTCTVTGLTNGARYTFTVAASNEHVIGTPSKPVAATPQVRNAAAGGVESTYTRRGRTFRVHTFYLSGTFVVSSGSRPFDILVVGGGGGSVAAPDGTVGVGGGGGVLALSGRALPTGQYAVVVGGGGDPGSSGAPTTLDTVGTGAAGAAASSTAGQIQPPVVSGINGTPLAYGGDGTSASGPGIDGRGTGAGGPASSRGGNGVVIISYEVG